MSPLYKTVGLAIATGALVCTAALSAGQAPAAQKASPAKPAAAAPAKHVLLPPDQIKWGPAPAALPPGAQAAAIDGDPAVAGQPFAVRLKFPANYRVPPHWHPADENIVVMSGALMLGMGDKADEASMHTLAPGGYSKMPGEMHHYAMTKVETVIHLYGTGPFGVTYVNPKDDPRTATK